MVKYRPGAPDAVELPEAHDDDLFPLHRDMDGHGRERGDAERHEHHPDVDPAHERDACRDGRSEEQREHERGEHERPDCDVLRSVRVLYRSMGDILPPSFGDALVFCSFMQISPHAVLRIGCLLDAVSHVHHAELHLVKRHAQRQAASDAAFYFGVCGRNDVVLDAPSPVKDEDAAAADGLDVSGMFQVDIGLAHRVVVDRRVGGKRAYARSWSPGR